MVIATKVTEADQAAALELAVESGVEITVSAKDCFLDGAYGREPKESRWRPWVNDWHDALFQRPILSERGDGTYAIIDGNHRICALRARSGDEASFKAVVLSNLDHETEAWLFVHLNTERQRPSQAEIFRGQLAAKEREAIDIDFVCTTEGVALYGVHTNSPGGRSVSGRKMGTGAIATIRDIYRRGGSLRLRKVFTTIKAAWYDDHGAFDRFQIAAVDGFLSRWKTAKEERLVEVMAKHRPGDLHRSASSLAENLAVGPRSLGKYGSMILKDWYNLGLRTRKLGGDNWL